MGDYMLFSYYLPLPYIKMDCALTGTTVPTVHYRAAPCHWLYHRRVADHGLSYIITFPLHLESAGQNVAQ